MSYSRIVDDAIRHRDRIRELAQRLTDSTIEDFARRGQHRPAGDGYPTSSRGGGAHSSEVARPTETAAVRLGAKADEDVADGEEVQPDTWEEHELDLVAKALDDAFAQLAEMAGVAKAMTRKLDFVVSVYAKANQRAAGAGDCQACDRVVTGTPNDRLRAGYCAACYMAWDRAGRPDRVAFEATREAAPNRRAC